MPVASDNCYCAIEGSCPGLDWTEEQKERTLEAMSDLWKSKQAKEKLPDNFDPDKIELFESKTRYEIIKEKKKDS